MSGDTHTTIVKVEVGQALAAEAKLQAATAARMEASRRLAAELDDAEKARISTLLRSDDASKRMAGARRDEVRQAKQAIATAKEQEAAIRQAITAEKQRESAIRVSVAAEKQREAVLQRTADAAARAAVAVEGISSSSSSLPTMGARIGSIVTGLQSMIAMAQQAAAVIGKLATDSVTAQNVSANLQIPIDGARDAFKGYVEDVELARIANMAFEIGVVQTGAELTALASGVQAKSEKLGVSATQLFENAVTGIGRGSALILDNLGIILDQAKAESIYAKSLGITVSQLNAYQKSQAFAKAATIEIAKAGQQATASTDGLAQSYQRATVALANFRAGKLGFTDTAGRTREAIRQLSEAELRNLKGTETWGAAVDQANETLGAYGVTLADVKALGSPVDLATAELQRRVEEGLEFERKQLEENNAIRARGLRGWAGETEHQIELQRILGAEESHLIGMQIEKLELEREASIILGNTTDEDRARTKEIERQLQLERARLGMAQLEESKPKRGGKRRDPNEALDRETAATLRLLAARTQIYDAELDGERDLDSVAATRSFLISLEREALDVREQAANTRVVKGAKEIAERDAELLEIATERRLLDVDAQKLEREEGRRHAEERLAEMDREIERQSALGVATGLLVKQRADANIAMLGEFGGTEELRQAEHEAAVIRIEEREAWRVRTAEGELAAFEREVELTKARGQVYVDEADARLALQAKIAAAEGNDDKRRELYHKREVQRIADRREKFQRAQQATNSLVGSSLGLAEAVANATMKNEAKREKFVLRVRGIEAVARGASETVEAVASYAALNIPQGILHTIAAATAFATGIPMIAGVVPGKASAAAAPGGGAAEHQTVVDTSGSKREQAKTPVSAEELTRLRSGSLGTTQTTASKGGGGTVINIGTMIAGDAGTILHDMDEQTAKKWGAA